MSLIFKIRRATLREVKNMPKVTFGIRSGARFLSSLTQEPYF